MTVVQFPLVQVEGFVHENRMPVVRDAISRIDRLISFYSEGCGRNPTTILAMIAAILDDPEFRKAAGIAGMDRTIEIKIDRAVDIKK